MNNPLSNRPLSIPSTTISSTRETGNFHNAKSIEFASITHSEYKSTCGSSPILSEQDHQNPNPNPKSKTKHQSTFRNSKPKVLVQESQSCESLVEILSTTIKDRLLQDNQNKQRHSSDLNQSITSLSTQISVARNELKSIKGSSLSIFDSLEKAKQTKKTLDKESDFIHKEIETTFDDVNSLTEQLNKLQKENDMINRDIEIEGDELSRLKEQARQTANDNNETMQMKRILTTSIVLARKEIAKIMNEVNGLVNKRATVREELDVMIKTYDY